VHRSDRLLETLAPYDQIVLVTHPNPDPDALASMMGLQAILAVRQPGKPVRLTLEGIVARAENQAMVRVLEIPLIPAEDQQVGPRCAVVMVDSQPRLGAPPGVIPDPIVVLDHHETPGRLEGVKFRDIRPRAGATATMIVGYLIEQGISPSPRLATALYYGIESEISGYPREAGPADDGALVWLFPRADKDLLAEIRNPRLPQSYFATFHEALGTARLYGNTVIAWCGEVPQPDIIAELADFFIRFDQVDWALTLGVFDGTLKLSLRADHIGGQAGEVLRDALEGVGSAGGHDKRAGGVAVVEKNRPDALTDLLATIETQFLDRLGIESREGRPLMDAPRMDNGADLGSG
jgi:nanoRNase/pAp phosphatase (c-di-AMP/oligoRNAs hydrolase)